MTEKAEAGTVETVKVGNLSQVMPKSMTRGKRLSKDNPLSQVLNKCVECEIKDRCGKFDEDKKARCFFQIANLKARYAKQDAFVSGNPSDLLVDIQTTINKYEESIRYHEDKGEQPDKDDLKELTYLKLQVFDMVYGRKTPMVATQVNVNASTMDIKELMKQMRIEEEKKNGSNRTVNRPDRRDVEVSVEESPQHSVGTGQPRQEGSEDKKQGSTATPTKNAEGTDGDA